MNLTAPLAKDTIASVLWTVKWWCGGYWWTSEWMKPWGQLWALASTLLSWFSTKENSGTQAGWELWCFPARCPTWRPRGPGTEHSFASLFLCCVTWIRTWPAVIYIHAHFALKRHTLPQFFNRFPCRHISEWPEKCHLKITGLHYFKCLCTQWHFNLTVNSIKMN